MSPSFWTLFRGLAQIVLAISLALTSQAALYYTTEDGKQVIARWSSDSGLDPEKPLDRELLDIYANQYPFMPGYSKALLGKDKFRPDFGPTLWRAVLESFQIIGMGQDATHIAEAAGRTATAGFGGRVTNFMEYFGAVNGVWINAYANTIKGQYGAYESPIFEFDKAGNPKVRFTGYVDAPLWLMSQDKTSEMVRARNNIIEWIIRKNIDNAKEGAVEAKLFALFGGAARDAMASFIISRGGKVGTRLSDSRAKRTQVPQMQLKYAGGNNQFPVPVDKQGRDIYQILAKKYEKRRLNYKNKADQALAKKLLKKHMSEVLPNMAFTYAGPNKNGLVHPGQIGGYDLWNVEIDGRKNTISLKGLVLSDGTRINHDILFVQFPHPSSLSRMTKADASEKVNRTLEALKPYKEKGWKIVPENGLTNKYDKGEPYRYGRSNIGPQNYDFGAPRNRMVPVSTASRNGSDKITFGTRDRAKFNSAQVEKIVYAKPAEQIPASEVIVNRPMGDWVRFVMDRGPGEKYAQMMTELLDTEKLEAMKPGTTWAKDGVKAHYVKSHSDVGPFGHYRGTFKDPRVLILADPLDYNDLISSRAMSGTRGQFIHGLMQDLGIGNRYLVLKTIPYIMDGATESDWRYVLENSNQYRERIIESVLSENKVEMVLVDGKYAESEAARIIKNSGVPMISLGRSATNPSSGIGLSGAAEQIKAEIPGYAERVVRGKRANIPRAHLPYLARWAEGIYGDLVVPAAKRDKNRGRAFQFIMPVHARKQKVIMGSQAETGLEAQLDQLRTLGFPEPRQKMADYFSQKRKPGKTWGTKPNLMETYISRLQTEQQGQTMGNANLRRSAWLNQGPNKRNRCVGAVKGKKRK